MKIYNHADIPAETVTLDGVKDVTMKMLIGPNENSENIFMRLFTVAPGGNTPWHNHNYEHVVKVERNRGIVVDEDGKEHEVTEGQSIYIDANAMHQFRNPNDEAFEFICIIPNPEKQ